jgi:hypothetical protein
MDDTRDIRRMTTRTSAISEVSSNSRCAVAKNRGPSNRYATMCSANNALAGQVELLADLRAPA